MIGKQRSAFLAVMTLAGVLTALLALPSALNQLFVAVAKGARSPEEPARASTSETFVFDRIVIDIPGKTLGQRAEAAAALTRDIAAGKTTFDAVAFQFAEPGLARQTRISRIAAEQSPDLQPLVQLDVGSVYPSPVYDERVKNYCLFRLSSVVRPTRGPDAPVAEAYPLAKSPATLIGLGLLGAILGATFGQLILRGSERFSARWERTETGEKLNLFLGIVAGLLGSLPFMLALGNLGQPAAGLITVGLMVGLSALGVFALRSMADVLPWKSTGVRARRSGLKIIDTNVLIDGRIYDLVRTGFFEGEIYVANFVLRELQFIADSSDALRRQRGRRGLDVLRHLQADYNVTVGTLDRHAGDARDPVDERLVRLAKAVGGDLVSNDYNLNRVASVQEVRVLNINDLALALRPNVLPGESLDLHVVREGNQHGQGVGYLEDGTMVVVENGREKIGEQVHVWVSQVIQTERGKMIFAELEEPGTDGGENGRRRGRAHRP
jgi:uncharacterized protein YacL